LADRFEDLRNFVTVAECGGVNAAAARLGIAKSAVSRRLSDLEERLGVALADRTRRRFALTTTGSAVLADAQRVLADLESLESRASRPRVARPLEVDADRDLLGLVAGAVACLNSATPGSFGTLHESGPFGERLRFSIGAGAGPIAVGSSRRCVYAALAADTSPRTPADIREMPAVSVASAGEDEWRFDGIDVAPRIVLTVPDLQTGLVAAAAGIGVVRAPEFAVRPNPWRESLREILRPRTADLFVSATMPTYSTAAADILVDVVRRSLRKD
jgi:DNA-binding transcriptional LysR family regulator